MGADMVLASLGFKADGRFELDQEQTKTVLAQARSAIEGLDQTRFDAINEELGGQYDDLAACKKQLLSDIADIESGLAGERRDATLISGGSGILLLASGGPTWGDPPTALSESIWRLAVADVFPDARWPKEPLVAEQSPSPASIRATG
jgi:hypothetical protein